MAVAIITSGTTWAGVATDGSNITVECIGGGGDGGIGNAGSGKPGAGGGGGAYALKTVAYVSGASVTVQIGTAIQDTNWNSGVVIAKSGTSGSGAGLAGTGGAAASCTPSTGAHSGGSGVASNATTNGGGGGGGAGGPSGDGKNGAVGGRGNVGDGHGGSSGGGAAGGSSTAGNTGGSSNAGAQGGTAQDGTAGGTGSAAATNSAAGNPGSHGSGGGGSGGSGIAAGSTGTGGAGGAGIEWGTAGAGGGGAGSGGRTAAVAITTGAGGAGGLYGGGGGGGGWQSGGTFGAGGLGAHGVIIVTYTAAIQTVTASGIASAEAFGTAFVKATIGASAIGSTEAFGSATLSVSGRTLTASAIPSAEAFGTAYIRATIGASAISSAGAFGTAFVKATIGASAIASAEAFGTATVAVSGRTVTASAIASAEAFGTPLFTAPIGASGIASAEAFGTATVGFSQSITAAAIASAEAFGLATLRQPTFARLTINGANRTNYLHYESGISWNLMIGQRGSCTLPLVVEPGDSFSPQIGEAVEIFDPTSIRRWAGTIEAVEVRWFGDDGWHLVTITGVSYESLFDTDQVDKLKFTNTAAGTIFAALYAASGVSVVTLGTVDVGVSIASIQVTRLSDAFSSLALQSNKVWGVDPDTKTLFFRDPLSVAAPWTMGAEDMVWETMRWKQTRADYRSSQVLQLPDGSAQVALTNTPGTSIGNRAARLTLTSAFTSAGAIQEATAALKRYSTMPSQLAVDTDRPGVSPGQLLTIDVDHPLESAAVLNSDWLVVEVDARIIPGLDQIDPNLIRMPADLVAGDKIGHFRYTLRLVNSLASAIFLGDGSSTVFALPFPGTVVSMKVFPNDSLYSKTSTSTDVTVTPAMPDGSTLLVTYAGDTAPSVPSFIDTLAELVPMAPTAGPAGADSGAQPDTDVFAAELSLNDVTVGDDIAPHTIVYHAGTAVRGLAVLRKLISADLTVRINKNGHEIVTVTIPDSTAVDEVLEFDVVVGSPPITAEFADKDVLSADILESDGSIDAAGVAVITIEWSSTTGA